MACSQWSLSYNFTGYCTSSYDGVYTKLLPEGHFDPQLIEISYSNYTSSCGGGHKLSTAKYSYKDVNGDTLTTTITVSRNSVSPHHVSNVFFFCNDKNRYDCLNGNCVLSNLHNGRGVYDSLAECEAVCGSDSGCNGECVGKGKIAQLKNLANRLKRKNCGH